MPKLLILTQLIPLAPSRFSSVQFSRSVMSTSLRPHGRSMPGLPVHHQLPEFTQTHVRWVGDAIQLSHPLSRALVTSKMASRQRQQMLPILILYFRMERALDKKSGADLWGDLGQAPLFCHSFLKSRGYVKKPCPAPLTALMWKAKEMAAVPVLWMQIKPVTWSNGQCDIASCNGKRTV